MGLFGGLGLGFLFTVYCGCRSGRLLLSHSPSSSLQILSPTFDFVNSTETGKLWPQSRADPLLDKTGRKLSLWKLEETYTSNMLEHKAMHACFPLRGRG